MKKRRPYLDDFRKNASGEYEYVGNCYAYDESENTRGSVLKKLWLLVLPVIAACVAGGCFTNPFMVGVWYTVGPYAFEIASVASIVWAVGRITANGRILREYVRKQTFGALPLRCWFAAGLAGAGLVGGIVYLILHGAGDQPVQCAVYLILKAIVAAFSVVLARFAPSVKWVESREKV